LLHLAPASFHASLQVPFWQPAVPRNIAPNEQASAPTDNAPRTLMQQSLQGLRALSSVEMLDRAPFAEA
jgi:hypothetical protein